MIFKGLFLLALLLLAVFAVLLAVRVGLLSRKDVRDERRRGRESR